MLEWFSDRMWNLADLFTAAASKCKKASIGILVYRMKREQRR